ncbi:MAG TPA: DNA polymerase IV [Candidatus Eisenbacteria bacterium]|uniref:DNA polymerase IV n=1 Tax=Eiseniibacteriota bacterium TaxID=2212470 RepID=A0A7V2F412_UNCEI|nr:DNA polymerase IV [Candidatus Eisenbacteria bacterium]
MDAFYASVERLDDPALEGKPVIVGGSSRRGVVSAASYEARTFGVHSAMPIFQARRLCPHGIFLPVRMQRYAEVSRVVMHCLGEFSPLVEQVSVDEAYVDLTGTRGLFGPPEEAARAIKRRIREATSLSCSIGLSTSKLIAKIASDMDKPDGLTVIPPGEVRVFLDTLPIGKVPGIGKKSEEELSKLGVARIGDLSRFKPEYLAGRFGAFGERLLAISRGEDRSPVVPYTAPKSISGEVTLEEDTMDPSVIRSLLLAQSDRVARRLRKQGFRGKTVTLKLKTGDFTSITRSSTLERPVQLAGAIYEEAVKLLEAERLKQRVRLVGVGVGKLEPADESGQLPLFDEKGTREEKMERAERAMDEIVDRFGRGALKRGSQLE